MTMAVASKVSQADNNNHHVNDQLLGRGPGSVSKMYFSRWEPPGVSERMWSVNLEASVSGEYQTLGGHSGRPSELLGPVMIGTGVPWE
jgi:hypothetical protein